ELVGGSSNRVYLHLSSDLADTGTHLLTATGLVDPNLDKFGFGAITPEIGDTF
ncbi:MAG: hypothetical protein GY834_03310, partial [Bacteroidetes bacterium]|nr:hypothetical protein [Bacteroidota bacterium]